MKGTTPRQRNKANGRKQAVRWNERRNAIAHRAALIRELRRAGNPLIPESVLKRLAALQLPPNEFVYQACLEKLLRSV